ncbi:glycosyltransferase [Desulfobacter hydrogenophilus]|nr:glycosyltransferase [Desulfobacter hydrogenophilus]NDY73801.1 glycosyltransferase [Desulfobacter hydrogenophilus]
MERLITHLANGLQKKNVSMMVVCLQDKGELAEEIIESKKFVRAIGSHGSKDIKAVWALRKLFKDFKPAIINIHDYSSLPYAALANLFFFNVPLMFTAHGLLYEGFEKLQKRYRFFSRFLSGFSAVSNAVANRHRNYLDWGKEIQVIPNGVPEIKKDDSLRGQVRNELGMDAHDILFLAVGNPRPEKGFEDLIQAAVALKSMTTGRFRFKIAVAGKLFDSEYCRMLLASINAENLKDCFMFLGFRRDTAALYNAADIFVLSSRSEGLPMVILEAMTAQLPVIATGVGGIPDAVGQAALLVDPQDPCVLAVAMHELMANPDKRNTLARKGQALVREKYSMEKMVDAYIQAYEDLVKIK